KLARRDRLPDVLDGLAAAAAAGRTPVKGNAVLMRALNDDEAAPLLRFCLDRGYELRFIEQMPLDAQHGWKRSEMVEAEEVLDARVRAVGEGAGGGVPRRPRPRVHPRPRRPAAARVRAGGGVPGGRRPGPGRRH